MKFNALSVVLLSFLLPAFATAAETAPSFKVLKAIHLSGDGGWDCLAVDSQARHLYATHDKRVHVLDVDSMQEIGKIEGTRRAHGVLPVPELGKGYIASGEDGKVLVFDLKSLRVTAKVDAQRDADGLVYEPITGRLFCFNGDSGNATVLDGKTDQVIKTLDLGGQPEFAVADGKGHVFDNLEDKNEVLRINGRSLKIEKRWSLAPGKAPSGIAMDPRSKRIFVGCRNKTLVVMSASNGKIVQVLPIGEHVDGVAFDPKTGNIYCACGDGTLSVIHEDKPSRFRLVDNAQTLPGARTIALDAATGHVFSAAAKTEAPPPPTKDDPKPRRKIVPGTFEVLEVGL